MKKIILLYLVLQLSHSFVNAQIGLAGNITTLGVALYPTHIDSLGKGGYMVLPTIAMRNSIPTQRRKQGMMVYVQSVDSLYKLNSASLENTWVTIGLSSSDDVSGFLKYAKTSDSLFITKGTRIDEGLLVKKDLTVEGSLFVKGRNIDDSIMKYSTTKLNVSDTSAMLLAYLNKINNLYTLNATTNSAVALKLNKNDTSTLSNRIELRVKYTDTASMLSNRIQRDTVSLSNRILSLQTSTGNAADLKLNISDTSYLLAKRDTANMLSSRFARDTANLDLRLRIQEQSTKENNALKIDADSAYKVFLQKKDTISLSNRIDAVVAASNVMQSDIKVNFGGGTFGKYNDQDIIPSRGKTIDWVLTDILTKVIAPYYAPPTASLTMGRSGTYEIGTDLSTLTFAPIFTQNKGGPFSSIGYYKNNSILATNTGSPSITDVVGPLLATKTYKVIYSYAAGTTILQNNLGQNDETLQVAPGTAESNTVTITPGSYKYWGITTKTSSNLTDADILAIAGGGQEWATAKGKGAFIITNSTGVKQFAFYAYPASLGDITEIWSGGFESKGGFDKVAKSFINASGAAVNYIIYIQKEVNGGTGNLTFSSIN